jgi:hypothetical protein
VRVKKSRRISWTVNVTRMGEVEKAYNNLFGYLTGRDHPEDLGVDGRIILEWILGK